MALFVNIIEFYSMGFRYNTGEFVCFDLTLLFILICFVLTIIVVVVISVFVYGEITFLLCYFACRCSEFRDVQCGWEAGVSS